MMNNKEGAAVRRQLRRVPALARAMQAGLDGPAAQLFEHIVAKYTVARAAAPVASGPRRSVGVRRRLATRVYDVDVVMKHTLSQQGVSTPAELMTKLAKETVAENPDLVGDARQLEMIALLKSSALFTGSTLDAVEAAGDVGGRLKDLLSSLDDLDEFMLGVEGQCVVACSQDDVMAAARRVFEEAAKGQPVAAARRTAGLNDAARDRLAVVNQLVSAADAAGFTVDVDGPTAWLDFKGYPIEVDLARGVAAVVHQLDIELDDLHEDRQMGVWDQEPAGAADEYGAALEQLRDALDGAVVTAAKEDDGTMDKTERIKAAVADLAMGELQAIIDACSPSGEYLEVQVFDMGDVDELLGDVKPSEVIRRIGGSQHFDANEPLVAFEDDGCLRTYTEASWRAEVNDSYLDDLVNDLIDQAGSNGYFYNNLPSEVRDILDEDEEEW